MTFVIIAALTVRELLRNSSAAGVAGIPLRGKAELAEAVIFQLQAS